MVPIFKGKGDALSGRAYRGVKLLDPYNGDCRKSAREEIAAYGESG
mgnify:CR=1 FL=1